MTAEESNLSPTGKKVRVFFITSRRILANYHFFSRVAGYSTISESVRAGVRQWIEGALELENDMREETLPTIASLKTIYGGELVRSKGKGDAYKFEVHFDQDLLNKFDELRFKSGLSRVKAINSIMFAQIKAWIKQYPIQREDAKDKTSTIESRDAGEMKLRQKLAKLIEDYGFRLEFEWIPKSEKNDGEVVADKIFIYSKTLEEAKETLCHEYIEYVLKTVFFSLPLATLLNKAVEVSNQELYKMQEKIIEKIVKALMAE
jgi:hypothetical protein